MKLRRRSRGGVAAASAAAAPANGGGRASRSLSSPVANDNKNVHAALFPPDALSFDDSLLDDEFPHGFIVDEEVSDIMQQERPLLIAGDRDHCGPTGGTTPHRPTPASHKQPGWFMNALLPHQRAMSPASVQLSSNSFRKSDDVTDNEDDDVANGRLGVLAVGEENVRLNHNNANDEYNSFRILGIQPGASGTKSGRAEPVGSFDETPFFHQQHAGLDHGARPKPLLGDAAFAYSPDMDDVSGGLTASSSYNPASRQVRALTNQHHAVQQQRQQRQDDDNDNDDDAASNDDSASASSLLDNDEIRPVDIQVLTGMLQANHQKEQEQKRLLKQQQAKKDQQRLERKQKKREQQQRAKLLLQRQKQQQRRQKQEPKQSQPQSPPSASTLTTARTVARGTTTGGNKELADKNVEQQVSSTSSHTPKPHHWAMIKQHMEKAKLLRGLRLSPTSMSGESNFSLRSVLKKKKKRSSSNRRIALLDKDGKIISDNNNNNNTATNSTRQRRASTCNRDVAQMDDIINNNSVIATIRQTIIQQTASFKSAHSSNGDTNSMLKAASEAETDNIFTAAINSVSCIVGGGTARDNKIDNTNHTTTGSLRSSSSSHDKSRRNVIQTVTTKESPSDANGTPRTQPEADNMLTGATNGAFARSSSPGPTVISINIKSKSFESETDKMFATATEAVPSGLTRQKSSSTRSAGTAFAATLEHNETDNVVTTAVQAISPIVETKSISSIITATSATTATSAAPDKKKKRRLQKLRDSARELTQQGSWTKRLPSFEGRIFRRGSKRRPSEGSTSEGKKPEPESKSPTGTVRSSSGSTTESQSRTRSSNCDDETDFTSIEPNGANQGLVGMIARALRGDAWVEEESIEEYTGEAEEASSYSSDPDDSSIRETVPAARPSRLFRMRGDDSFDYTSEGDDEDMASDLRSAFDDFLDSSCTWHCCSPKKTNR